jgi:diguanylate cyclase (GGDEF)-like protein/PAS domain S-box-containing protein
MSTIVIVDDQSINRSIYAKMAEAVGHDVRVETFADPRKALCAMRERTPDLIVTDYRMPGMNGASFIRRVRSEPALADIPTIVITVYAEKSYRMRALDAGATDFLLSPVDHREFVTRARNLLKLRKQQALLAARAKTLEQKLECSERSLVQTIRYSSERLAQVIDCVPVPISATDRNGRSLFANDCHARIFGTDPATPFGRDPQDIFGEENAARRKALDQLVLRSGRSTHSFEEEIVDQSGRQRVFLTSKSPLTDGSDNTCGVVTCAIDITDQKMAQHHLQFLAHHDSLTGIANRVYLFEQIIREIARARRGDRRFALHLIDLDGFKEVNDLKGHSIGDEILASVAKRLGSIQQEGCIIARLGGDEFAVLQIELMNIKAAEQLAEEIVRAFRKPFVTNGGPALVTASVGVAIYPSDGQNIEELLRHADVAMYKAKAEGRDQCRIYDSRMEARASTPIVLAADLRQAIEREEFVLQYQPQVRLDSREVHGVEALLRWQKRDGTLLLPGLFLPRAEENGLILPINEWVLRQACHQAAAWHRAGMQKVRIGVNLSAIQFRRQTLPLLVTQALNESGLDPSFIELELTENFLMRDADQVVNQLKQLRDLGVVISIDDFGTGFSSLSYVKRLPVDRLKIDQTFIHDLVRDPNDRAIVAAIINLAHSLKMEVVAEGVETADQFEWLRAAGCDEAQGFYCGLPMKAADFATFIAPPSQVAIAG